MTTETLLSIPEAPPIPGLNLRYFGGQSTVKADDLEAKEASR